MLGYPIMGALATATTYLVAASLFKVPAWCNIIDGDLIPGTWYLVPAMEL